MTRILLFMVSCLFTHNIVLDRAIGAGALLDDSRRIETAAAVGLLVTALMTVTAAVNWVINSVILVPLAAGYLQLPVYMLIIGLAMAGVELLYADKLPVVKGHVIPLAATCAILGTSLLNTAESFGFADAVLNGLFGGLGFLVAIVLMAGIHERIRFSRVPEPLKGFPISLISAGLMALAFMGFMGMA